MIGKENEEDYENEKKGWGERQAKRPRTLVSRKAEKGVKGKDGKMKDRKEER